MEGSNSLQGRLYGFIKHCEIDGNKILQTHLSEKFIMLKKSILYYGY
jgi:hypothetical protein